MIKLNKIYLKSIKLLSCSAVISLRLRTSCASSGALGTLRGGAPCMYLAKSASRADAAAPVRLRPPSLRRPARRSLLIRGRSSGGSAVDAPTRGAI
jgi:hypothetical protein